MITQLTDRQREQVAEYQSRYWRQATSTEPADRERAEKAARRLAEIGRVSGEIAWVDSPEEGQHRYEAAWDSLSASLRASLRASLSASLRASLWASLRASLSASLRASLRASLSASLWDSLWDSLWASLSASLRASLSASFWASLWDSGWLAYYTYAIEVLGTECSQEHRELLGLYNEIAASCFAIWITPGQVILCERPATVEIEGGNLVGLTWKWWGGTPEPE